MNEDTERYMKRRSACQTFTFPLRLRVELLPRRCQVNTVAAAVLQEPTGPVSQLRRGAKQETRRDETRVKPKTF